MKLTPEEQCRIIGLCSFVGAARLKTVRALDRELEASITGCGRGSAALDAQEAEAELAAARKELIDYLENV